MRRVWMALALLALLVFGSWWSLRAVERTTADIAALIEAGELDAAHRRWDEAQTLLGSLLLHDELDTADRLFDRVLAAQDAGDAGNLALDRTELLSQLRHLPDLERPSLINLL